MNYRTLADMAAIIRKNLHRIPRLPVVGIPRSGMIAASMIATLRNVPLWTFTDAFVTDKECLLVDDSISGGETFWNTMLRFTSLNMPKPITLAVYAKPLGPKPDLWFEEIPGPRLFEWNWAKHTLTKRAVLDIDGVICDEAEKIKDWSDEAHVSEVRQRAQLLHKTTKNVLALATGRRESERPITEDWLRNHGIRYQHIYFSTPQRTARETKLLAAQETGAQWIVESNIRQAEWLADRSGLPVLCTDQNEMLLYRKSQG